MAVSITVTGLSVQQRQDLAAAFIATQGPLPDGMTQAQFVTYCTLRFWKAVVKGWKRRVHEETLVSEQNAVDADYGDQVE